MRYRMNYYIRSVLLITLIGRYALGFGIHHYPLTRTISSTSLQMSSNKGEVATKIEAGKLVRELVPLSCGVVMEVLIQRPSPRAPRRPKSLPPLVFIHGSYHGAWCWAEHWQPFFSSKGYDTYSLSLRGTSGTPLPQIDSGKNSVQIQQHVDDVQGFLQERLGKASPAVLVAHSFGGVVIMKILEAMGESIAAGSVTKPKPLAGAALLCSVPPSGNGPMSMRFLKSKPRAAIKILLGFVLKLAVRWNWLARDLFFSPGLSQQELARYMTHFREDSRIGLDLRDLTPKLPIKAAIPYTDSKTGETTLRAPWLKTAPPMLVVGCERDYIVDDIGVKELADFLGTEATTIPLAPHDIMLGPDWPLGASRLLNWLEELKV